MLWSSMVHMVTIFACKKLIHWSLISSQSACFQVELSIGVNEESPAQQVSVRMLSTSDRSSTMFYECHICRGRATRRGVYGIRGGAAESMQQFDAVCISLSA